MSERPGPGFKGPMSTPYTDEGGRDEDMYIKFNGATPDDEVSL